jgi:hypothetical protein
MLLVTAGIFRRPHEILSFNHKASARILVDIQCLRLRCVATDDVQARLVNVVSPLQPIQMVYERVGSLSFTAARFWKASHAFE